LGFTLACLLLFHHGTGLVAEEVAVVDLDLITRNDKGEIPTVRYEAVNAMLLNEFLKAHRKLQEQQTTIERQQDCWLAEGDCSS
jgi:hypothetical protein